MQILTYKRTHVGDPDSEGRFGINGCMGRVRNWRFDAVIGVGGTGAEPTACGIAGRITWVGLNPTWKPHPDGLGQVVTFDSFALLDDEGPLLRDLAPLLARRMYERKARTLLSSYSGDEKLEAEGLIRTVLGRDVRVAKASLRRSRCRNRIGPKTLPC
jgi:hypothetical protein